MCSSSGTKCWVYLLLSLCVLSSELMAQWKLDDQTEQRIQRGIDYIYNIEFEKADREFAEVIKTYPDHPVGYFFQAMTGWWRILSDFENESLDGQFNEMLEHVIELCDKRLEKDKSDITALFFKGGSIGFRGRLRANRGKWLGAANDAIVALPIVRKAHQLDPNNFDILLGVGIYNYYAEVIPQQYPIIKPVMLFLPSGDRKKGLEELQQAANSGKYAQTEAKYFLLQSHFTYEKRYDVALKYAQELHQKYPRNPLFHRYHGRSLVSLGYWADAFMEFTNVLNRFLARQEGYDDPYGREAYYYTGKFHFMSGEFDRALQEFYRCDELSRKLDKDGASGFMSMANLTIGMIYDVQKKRPLALEQYRKVLRMKEYESTHKEARRYLDQPYSREK